jgi:4-amino-4-deoxy-L-arabinose transferase-like glycosyltransferase
MPLSRTYQPDNAFARTPARHLLPLFGLWLIIFFAALFSPPLLDDADATHAQAARAMALTGDWVTLHVDGIRYLEKPPLPYWLVAICFRIFGYNTFAVHLPSALAVLALAALGYLWARQAFDDRTAFYTALATLTCTGIFLFTRIFIPEVLLSLLLCVALFSFLHALDPLCPRSRLHSWLMWVALALAVLTKGFVALVFFFGAALLFLALTGEFRHWRRLRPLSGIAIFLVIAAPWHILASLRNTGGADGHGFFWFYFINEHVLRFLGRRIPRDYNKLPGYLYWSLHLVWLFPWSLFAPVALISGWRLWRQRRNAYAHAVKLGRHKERPIGPPYGVLYALRYLRNRFVGAIRYATNTQAARTTLLLAVYSALILVFFSISTNQEYYTFPIYLPLLMLTCAALAKAERTLDPKPWALDPVASSLRRTIFGAHIAYTAVGLAVAAALAYGLWSARGLAYVPDIGDLLAHRGVGDYTLSMSHFFDLTGPSFAALRLPATLALIAFAIGPAAAWMLRYRRKNLAATVTIALTSALFLISAHIALNRFSPMLSSQDFAEKIEELADDGIIERDNDVLLFGDQAYGSSIAFYLDEEVELVDGRSTSMLFGSSFPDAPHIFLTPQELAQKWGHGRRKILFVPLEKRAEVERLLGANQILLEETSGKILITDRPLGFSASYR